MLPWATQRRLIIVAIIFLVCVIAAFFAYRAVTNRPASCFDGRQNGNETGVDCGGACNLLCSHEVNRPIMRWDPRIFEVSPGVYSLLVYAENPNVNAEAKSVGYGWRVFSADGAMIAEQAGNTSIPKHSRFAVFESGLAFGNVVPARAVFTWNEPISWTRNEERPLDVFTRSVRLLNAETAPRVEAVIENRSPENIATLELTAVVFDGSGNAVGASRTVLADLARNSQAQAVFTWPQPFRTTEEVCEFPVDAVVAIDRSGSMASLGNNPPEPLTAVKNAAMSFIMSLSDRDRVAVVTFANDATVDFPLSFDRPGAEYVVQNIAIGTGGIQNTNISDSIVKTNEALGPLDDATRRQVLVLLTDGEPTVPTRAGAPLFPETAALAEADALKSRGVSIFTIGLGREVKDSFLMQVASSSEEYFASPDTEALSGIYSSIATAICTKKPVSVEILYRFRDRVI